MSDRHALRLAIVPRPIDSTFTGLDYWLRFEQIVASDIAEPSEIAEIVDELYGIEACSPEPPPEEEQPPITWDRLMEIAKRRLDIEECRRLASGTYTARVKMIYSHPNDPNNRPKAAVTIGRIVSRRLITEDISLTLQVREQTSLTLDYPVLQEEGEEWPGKAKWLGSVFNEKSGAIKPPEIIGSGNVLSWGTVATGTILVKVPTIYEIIEIEVPGIPKLGSLKGDSQPTTLRVFWRLQVYEFSVDAAANDTRADGQTLAQICGWDSYTGSDDTGDDGGLDGTGSDGGDDGAADDPPVLGCLEPAEDLANPDYYKKVCCHPPDVQLPDCALYASQKPHLTMSPEAQEEIRRRHRGRVEFVAVGPGPDGCGILYTRQNVTPRPCCAEIPPQRPHPDNPSSMPPSGNIRLDVLDGRAGELRLWQASGGLYFSGGATKLWGGTSMQVFSPPAWCAFGLVRVDDGCTILSMRVDNSSPPEPLSLTYEGGEIGSGTAMLEVAGGLPPYTLVTNGAHTRFSNDRQEITIAGEGFVAMIVDEEQLCDGDFQVTVADACTKTASVTVPVGEVLGVMTICWMTGGASSLIAWTYNDCAPIPAPDNYPRYVRFSGYSDTSTEVESGASCLPVGTWFAYGGQLAIPMKVVVAPRTQNQSGFWYYPITYTGLTGYQLLHDPPCEDDPC